MSIEGTPGSPAGTAGGGLATGRPVVDTARHRGLDSVPGYPFEVWTSASTRDHALRLAARCARADSYLSGLLSFRPTYALVVLDRSDWAERSSSPLYGMPYYNIGNLFLAGEPSDLAAWLEEASNAGPPEAARALAAAYGSGPDRLAPFADLLVVHELAHAFHDGLPFLFPRSWLSELFANMALYAFVQAEEPEHLAHLETLIRVVLDFGLIDPVARDLRYFEAHYPSIEPLTYVWYQFRFTMLAQARVDATGPEVLRRMWDGFAVSDERLARQLGAIVHPAAAEWLAIEPTGPA